MTYDFLAFLKSKQADPNNPEPIYVHSSRRVHHDAETDVPPSERDETIESREYSDGFGRLLQTRAQAEDVLFGDLVFGDNVLPADQNDQAGTMADVVGRQRAQGDPPNVVVSGWQFYDNKGRVVEKYEPFYSTGFDYAAPIDAQFGEKVTMFYDPRGQVIRTVNPDGSDGIKIQQVLLYFARADGQSFEVPVSYLHYNEQGTAGAVGGGATSIDGVISTRRGNAGSWTAKQGKSAVGEWELAFANSEEMRNRFKKEEIEDILLVLTYSGRTPDWPN